MSTYDFDMFHLQEKKQKKHSVRRFAPVPRKGEKVTPGIFTTRGRPYGIPQGFSWKVESDCKLKRMLLEDLLGGGFKYFLFSPLLGEDSQFD